jgi:hypothetical protein
VTGNAYARDSEAGSARPQTRRSSQISHGFAAKGDSTIVRVFVALVIFAGLALPAAAQSSAPSGFVGPDGEKQFGPYTWVWKSRTFQPAQTGVTVEARCPAGDVVLGGGVIASPLWRDIANSRPSPNFDGWRVHFYKYAQGGTFTVTVYASCAPTQ